MIITVFKILVRNIMFQRFKYIAVDYIRQNRRDSVFTPCKMRKENIISLAKCTIFDRKNFCGKFELCLEFGFSIWLLVTTADINKPDLSSWIYLYSVFSLTIGKTNTTLKKEGVQAMKTSMTMLFDVMLGLVRFCV